MPEKTCKSCGHLNHVRRSVCTNCNEFFEYKIDDAKLAARVAKSAKKFLAKMEECRIEKDAKAAAAAARRAMKAEEKRKDEAIRRDERAAARAAKAAKTANKNRAEKAAKAEKTAAARAARAAAKKIPEAPPLSDYEKLREANIERNQKKMLELFGNDTIVKLMKTKKIKNS